MAKKFRLSEGALQSIARSEHIENPIMQILGSKLLAVELVGTVRVRLLLSDGRNTTSYATITVVSRRFLNGDLENNTIIKVKNYKTSILKTEKGNRLVLVLLDLKTLLHGRYTTKIGNPEPLYNLNASSNEDLSPPLPAIVPLNIDRATSYEILNQETCSPPLPPTIPLPPTNNTEEESVNLDRVTQDDPLSLSDLDTDFFIAPTIPLPLNKSTKDECMDTYSTTLYDDAVPSTSSSFVNNLQLEENYIPSQILGNRNNRIMHNDEDPDIICPISSLTAYRYRWPVRVRVCKKSRIHNWKRSRSEGKLFSMDLSDRSGEICCKVFNDLVDKFYNTIVEGNVYCISNYKVRFADKRFHNLKNDYEMHFSNNTVVTECYSGVVPEIVYNFTNIYEIQDKEIGMEVDVIGVCKEISDVQTIHTKRTGRELKKREITLVDRTNTGVVLNIWGDDTEKPFEFSEQIPVIAVKRAKVAEFSGAKNLSAHAHTILKLDPYIPEACILRTVVDIDTIHDGILNNISISSITSESEIPWLTLQEVQEQHLEDSRRSNYFKTKVTILLFRTNNLLYKACPFEECKKKVVDLGNGQYRCEKCNCDYHNFKYRFIGTVNVGDSSSDMWISMFSPEVEKILETTSNEVAAVAETNPGALEDFATKASFKQYTMKCYTKMETFRDESRLKTVAVKVDDINYKEYNEHLISRINSLLNKN
ncbi:hypothetical protein ILUMI_04295 [Ignelater luminosus]|uniref:Replication protein A subunit n=1 Tax=Ignelater luminosus TaxID=2038154 RepID=A0A8K0DCW1_IGNLU|nr:hypothetical protein ILUMI_04295 [Ignelater luminosus]